MTQAAVAIDQTPSWIDQNWHPAIINMAENLPPLDASSDQRRDWTGKLGPFCGVAIGPAAIEALRKVFDGEEKFRHAVLGAVNALFGHHFLACTTCGGVNSRDCQVCEGDHQLRLTIDDEDVVMALMVIWHEGDGGQVSLYQFLRPFGWGDDVCTADEKKWLERTRLRILSTGV